MSKLIKLSVSIVIPNYNGEQILVETISCAYKALDTSGIVDYEIIVSDDASTDESFHQATSIFPELIFIKSDVNTGFAGNMNRGISRATKELVCFLNSDVHLSSGYFSSQLSLFQDEQTFGVMGAILDKQTNEPQDGAKNPHIGLLKIESNKNTFSATQVLPTLFLSGANALVRRKHLLELGGFCELFNPYYSEDVDLGLQAWRNGWSLYFQPASICYHEQSSTIKKLPNNKVKIIAKRNKHFLHFLHLPSGLNWAYLAKALIQSFAHLLVGKTLRLTAFFLVFKEFKSLRLERKNRGEKTPNKKLLSVFQVKEAIDGKVPLK